MSTTPWICTRCVTRLANRGRAFPTRRWQSSTSRNNDISPVLLSRARNIANEHASLSKQLAREFDAKAAKRAVELNPTASALKEYEDACASLTELHALLKSSDKELQLLAKEDVEPTNGRIEDAVRMLKSSLLPVHPFSHLPCLLEIQPGAGGDEAALFAGDLLRMYQNFCTRKGLDYTLLKLESPDTAISNTGSTSNLQVQEAVLEVDSPGAYGVLRCEAGVHRVQRVPATESKGRTHTSAASVLVLPVIGESSGQENGVEDFDDPKSDYYVDPKDVRTDVMRASGAGGQHVNRTESAVRLTHDPTGTVVQVQEMRSQLKNRERAWKLLRSRIAQQRREEREAEIARMRRGAGAGKTGRGDKIRTYNWGQQRVSDHRSGIDMRNLGAVLEGEEALDRVMDSVKTWMAEQEMLALVEDTESR